MKYSNLVVARCASFFVMFALAITCTAPVTAHAQAALNSARVVYVGHSLINYDIPEMVKTMAEARGLVHRRAAQINNGTGIRANWDGCHKSLFVGQWPPLEFACDSIEAGTDLGPYDTLIITQGNNPIINPSNPSSLGTTPDDFERFLNLFLTHNPSGRAFYFTQWEGLDSQWHNGQEWTDSIAREMTLFEQITDRIEQISRDAHGRNVDVNIIPTNYALRDLVIAVESGRIPGMSNRRELFGDDVHPTNLANYYLACVVFASVYQQSPVGVAGRMKDRWSGIIIDVPSDMALRLQILAWQVVTSYRGWSSGSSPSPSPRPKAPSSVTVN
jgi:hypothetical protein